MADTEVIITGMGAISPHGRGVAALWDGLLSADREGAPYALLVVSHRPAVLDRADRIVTLDRGRIASATVVA